MFLCYVMRVYLLSFFYEPRRIETLYAIVFIFKRMAPCVKYRYHLHTYLIPFFYLRLQGVQQAKGKKRHSERKCAEQWRHMVVLALVLPLVQCCHDGPFCRYQHGLAPKTMQQIEQQAQGFNGHAGRQGDTGTVGEWNRNTDGEQAGVRRWFVGEPRCLFLYFSHA